MVLTKITILGTLVFVDFPHCLLINESILSFRHLQVIHTYCKRKQIREKIRIESSRDAIFSFQSRCIYFIIGGKREHQIETINPKERKGPSALGLLSSHAYETMNSCNLIFVAFIYLNMSVFQSKRGISVLNLIQRFFFLVFLGFFLRIFMSLFKLN